MKFTERRPVSLFISRHAAISTRQLADQLWEAILWKRLTTELGLHAVIQAHG